MDAPKPNQYIVRCAFGHGYQTVEFTVWAYTAEDAKVQVELIRKGDPDLSFKSTPLELVLNVARLASVASKSSARKR
jgi:hypothetical protein